MIKNMKLFAGMIVFGSLWGFSECIIGPIMADTGLPSGMLMTGIFTMMFLVLSRMMFQQRGMQMGMGLIAGSLRMMNPLGGCHLCSAFAIMAEGMIFELIWNYTTTHDLSTLHDITTKVSLGVFTAFMVYTGGYIVTQIMTPIVSIGSFQIANLLLFLPQILSKALIVGLIGGITIPIILSSNKLHISLKESMYYPATLGISLFCWTVIIGNWFFYIS